MIREREGKNSRCAFELFLTAEAVCSVQAHNQDCWYEPTMFAGGQSSQTEVACRRKLRR